jgi:hypothetical protein
MGLTSCLLLLKAVHSLEPLPKPRDILDRHQENAVVLILQAGAAQELRVLLDLL